MKTDRVRYYSTERSQWEEIPLEMVDLDRTKSELAERQAEIDAEAKAGREEKAIRAERKQVARVPPGPGVYIISGEKVEPIKPPKSRSIQQDADDSEGAISDPDVPGKSTVELDGDHAPFRLTVNKPEFYFRLSDYERFAIVRLTPKKSVRVVEKFGHRA